MPPVKIFCEKCEADRTLLGIRCVICGEKLTEPTPATISPAAQAVGLIDEHPWVLLTPIWLWGLLTLAITDKVWDHKVILVKSTYRDVVPGENLLFVLVVGSALYFALHYIRARFQDGDRATPFWGLAVLVLLFLATAVGITSGGGSLGFIGEYV